MIKKAITIVFMSKESYRKVWEAVKLTAKNEMLFYLPRTMEKWQNPNILWRIWEDIIHTLHNCDKEVRCIRLTRPKGCRRWEEIVKKPK